MIVRSDAPWRGALALAAAMLVAGSAPLAAGEYQAGGVKISRAWARATPGGATTAAAYLSLELIQGEPDRLLAASTPMAAQVMLHATQSEGGVMRMVHLEAIELRPGAPETLAPGGTHLMLTGLAAPLRQGETLPLVLTFERAGTVEIAVPVLGVGAAGPDR